MITTTGNELSPLGPHPADGSLVAEAAEGKETLASLSTRLASLKTDVANFEKFTSNLAALFSAAFLAFFTAFLATALASSTTGSSPKPVKEDLKALYRSSPVLLTRLTVSLNAATNLSLGGR